MSVYVGVLERNSEKRSNTGWWCVFAFERARKKELTASAVVSLVVWPSLSLSSRSLSSSALLLLSYSSPTPPTPTHAQAQRQSLINKSGSQGPATMPPSSRPQPSAKVGLLEVGTCLHLASSLYALLAPQAIPFGGESGCRCVCACYANGAKQPTPSTRAGGAGLCVCG